MKNAALFLVLFSFSPSIFCYGQSLDAQLKELKNARYTKMLELSSLAEKIVEKDRLLTKIADTANLEISNKDDSKVIHSSLKTFGETLEEAIKVKKNVNNLFVKELFKNNQFNKLRFAVARTFCEQDLLKTLVERYEKCQQDIIEIDQKLVDLQNKAISQN